MMKFNYNLPVNLVFGRGRIEEIGELTARYGSRAMIVTGRSSTKKSGLLDRVISLLAQDMIEAVVYDKVSQNPLTTTAEEVAMNIREEKCDVVIGLGGGSILDCSKAAAFLSVNSGDINDYIFGIKNSEKALPLIAVPTTCGTGSEGNGFAVLTNPFTGDKKSLRCNAIVPKASIIDSTLMETLPKSILASVGFDALCHNMEAYLSEIAQPITSMMALEGFRLVADNLVKIYKGNGDAKAYDELTLGSTFGGMVINTAGVALPHGMEHPASGLRDITHGKGLAALTPVIMERTIEGNEDKFRVLGKILGGKNEGDFIPLLNKLLSDIDLKIGLREQGISEEDVDWMVENCLKVSMPSINNHPTKFTSEQIREMYIQAL